MSCRTNRFASRVIGVPIIAAAVMMSAMCGDSPTAPGGGPPARVLTGVALVGPATLAPGESVQFRLEVVYSDGSRGEPSTPVVWQGTSGVISISDSGLVTGGQTGRGTVSARLGNRQATREINVVPAGTFWLDGIVTETGSTSFTLSNTTVTAISGTGAGASAVSRADGRYSLFGIAGQVRIRFERDGYTTREIDADVNAPRTLDADLELSTPRPSFTGEFTLTISASAACRAQLPESAWERRYSAQLRQNGPAVTGTLSGASFANYSGAVQNSFRGQISGNRLEISMSPWDSYYYLIPGLIETLSPDAYYAPSLYGSVTGSSEFRGALNGWIYVFRDINSFNVASSCSSSSHEIVLSR